ncbi:salivary glue protein Sgs-3-like [Eriocheir sinensis]|uniref:salivary glue protein Sgs-3-like n=1 Tax=Eriocheir sinensis TaxID=95602 RepID=UPI0021C63CB9|nr:salivary glue protein Sgs-3-like [Eriocheir sinensis]
MSIQIIKAVLHELDPSQYIEVFDTNTTRCDPHSVLREALKPPRCAGLCRLSFCCPCCWPGTPLRSAACVGVRLDTALSNNPTLLLLLTCFRVQEIPGYTEIKSLNLQLQPLVLPSLTSTIPPRLFLSMICHIMTHRSRDDQPHHVTTPSLPPHPATPKTTNCSHTNTTNTSHTTPSRPLIPATPHPRPPIPATPHHHDHQYQPHHTITTTNTSHTTPTTTNTSHTTPTTTNTSHTTPTTTVYPLLVVAKKVLLPGVSMCSSSCEFTCCLVVTCCRRRGYATTKFSSLYSRSGAAQDESWSGAANGTFFACNFNVVLQLQ